MSTHTHPHFGPAGRSDSFKALGGKTMADVPGYLAHFGLDAFEFQAGHGVRLSDDSAAGLARGLAQGVQYSIHAPYYISMASPDPQKRENSLRYLLESAHAVRRLSGQRVIFHCGSVGKLPRPQALEMTAEILARGRRLLDEEGFEDIVLCPETMGRPSQIGSLEEILALCAEDKRHIPCLDMGHLNCLAQGGIAAEADYAHILDCLAEALPGPRTTSFHVHFSKIEYTAAGERRHLTFADTTFGPPYEPFLKLCARRGLAPVVICESSGTQAEDARTMKHYYDSLI